MSPRNANHVSDFNTPWRPRPVFSAPNYRWKIPPFNRKWYSLDGNLIRRPGICIGLIGILNAPAPGYFISWKEASVLAGAKWIASRVSYAKILLPTWLLCKYLMYDCIQRFVNGFKLIGLISIHVRHRGYGNGCHVPGWFKIFWEFIDGSTEFD